MHRAACGTGVMQLPALLSPGATLPWPLVVMDFVLYLELAHTKDRVPSQRFAVSVYFCHSRLTDGSGQV